MRYSIKRTIYPMVALLLLAACSQDEMPGDGNTLPEGVYPLEIASVTMDVTHSEQPWSADAPQTRVSESEDGMSSHWDKGDIIHVKLGDQETTYRVSDTEGNLELEGEKLYWKKRTDNVTAWYASPETDGTINLADQNTDNKLAYVLQAKEENASCENPVTLKFTHALAKVRVVLEGSDADRVDDVRIKTYTSCTLNADGTLKAEGDPDFISMVPVVYEGSDEIAFWEANVVPTEAVTDGYKISGFKVRIKDSDTYLEGTLKNGGIAPAKAKVNTITLTVGKPLTEITGGENIAKPGDYIMKGNITESVTLNAEGINLTLENVQANTNDAPLIIGENAQVTLNISGTANSLTSANGNGIEMKNSASLTITGSGRNASKLEVKASDNSDTDYALKAGIGPSTGDVSIGMIDISNVHLVVSGGKTKYNGAGPAAIGLCSLATMNDTHDQSCDGISITDSKIEATSYGGACIGTGSVSNDRFSGGEYNLKCITIKNSEITATSNNDTWGNCGSCIGFGYIGADATGVIGKIEITSTKLNLTVTNSNAFKVGRGNKRVSANASYSIADGIIVDGQNKGSEGWNP